MNQSATGNACAGPNVRWLTPQLGSVIYGFDITSKASQTVASCRQFCWETPGCVSADFHNDGVCYLNYDGGSVAKDISFAWLQRECCDSKSVFLCVFVTYSHDFI